MSASQSAQIKAIVDELTRLQQQYEIEQATLRAKLFDLFGDGPATPQREIVKQLVDMFLFPNL
jgi:hypothetical protein